jgi:hypothetical protein
MDKSLVSRLSKAKKAAAPPSDEQIKAGFPKLNPKWAEIPITEVLVHGR